MAEYLPGQRVRRHRPLRPADRRRRSRSSSKLGLKNVQPEARQHPRRGRVLRHVRLHHLPRRVLVGADRRCGTRSWTSAPSTSTPNGVAYVIYNTYPGWHMRGMIRDMMRYHADAVQHRRSSGSSRPAPARLPRPVGHARRRRVLACCSSSELETHPPPGRPLPVPRAPGGGERPAVLPPVRRAMAAAQGAAVPGRGADRHDGDRQLRPGHREDAQASSPPTRSRPSSTWTSSATGCSARRCCAGAGDAELGDQAGVPAGAARRVQRHRRRPAEGRCRTSTSSDATVSYTDPAAG